MKTLGIDFGLKNFGLAVSESQLAEPLQGLKVASLKTALEKIVFVCKKNQIEKIILGLPEGKLEEKIRKFGKELEQKTNIPVFLQDETLTSQSAVEKMIEAQKPLKKRQKQGHIFAACLILQSYLDENKQFS